MGSATTEALTRADDEWLRGGDVTESGELMGGARGVGNDDERVDDDEAADDTGSS